MILDLAYDVFELYQIRKERAILRIRSFIHRRWWECFIKGHQLQYVKRFIIRGESMTREEIDGKPTPIEEPKQKRQSIRKLDDGVYMQRDGSKSTHYFYECKNCGKRFKEGVEWL